MTAKTPRPFFQTVFSKITPLVMLAFMFMSVSAYATVTITSISGFSHQSVDENQRTVLSAALASTCSSTTTCDTCTGEAGLSICSKNAVGEATYLNIQFTVSNLTAITADQVIARVNDRKVLANITIQTGTVRLEIPWRELCGGGTGSCSGSEVTSSLEVGAKSGSGSEAVESIQTLIIKIRSLSSTSLSPFHALCPTDATVVDPNEGFCFFKPYPGDAKVYADELRTGADYPASGSGGINYKMPLFFYEEQQAGEADAATLARITNGSSYIALLDPDADVRLDGLSNDVRYCFVMATEDEAGVISRFTPVASVTDPASLCATPSEVVGLLDDKSCFIATAAYGSVMAPQVQAFRDFRDKYLLSNSVGTNFVKFYYKHSPKYAAVIAENEYLRTLVRGILWIPLLVTKVVVVLGFLPVLLILLSLGAAAFVFLSQRAQKDSFEETF